MDIKTLTDEELAEDLYICGEHLGEIEAEHLGETARYGDSWPGAQLQVNAARSCYAALRAEAERRAALVNFTRPASFGGLAPSEAQDVPF